MRPCSFALVLACAAFAQAQTPLIKFNLVAVDHHGKPVADLKPEELQVRDQNQPRAIVLFRKNDAQAKIAAPAPLGPHEFSNRSDSVPPAVTLILLDLVNLTATQQGYARSQLSRVLEKMDSPDYVYLYLLTLRGPFAVRPLPIGQSSAPSPGWPQNAGAILEDAFRRVNRLVPEIYIEDRVKLTYMSLAALSSGLAEFPGRKSIVWISRGVPIEVGPRNSANGTIVEFQPLLRELTAAVDNATVSIYPVGDLSTPAVGSEPLTFDPGHATGQVGAAPVPSEQMSVTGGNIDTLTEMAQLTGGRVHLNNDISAAVREAAADAQLNYTIGYAAGDADNKFHKIRVTCSRRGVRILAKDGYYNYAGETAAQEKAAIESAVWSSLDSGEIGLHVAVSPSQKIAHGSHFEIKIDAADVRLTNKDGQDSGELSVLLVAYDDAGHADAPPAVSYPLHMTAAQLETAQHGGITVSQDRPMADTVRRVRVIVIDDVADTIGSVTLPVAAEDRSANRE